MMTTQQLKQAHVLLQDIEAHEKLLAKYREAKLVTVGLPNQSNIHSSIAMTDEVRMTSAEIGGAIIKVLEERIATKKEALHKQGVA